MHCSIVECRIATQFKIQMMMDTCLNIHIYWGDRHYSEQRRTKVPISHGENNLFKMKWNGQKAMGQMD